MDVASLVIKRFFFQRIFLSMRLAENMNRDFRETWPQQIGSSRQ